MAGQIKMPRDTEVEVGLDPHCIVLDGRPDPLKGAQHHHFSAHVYCGQMAGWIKMSLGTEVDLGPGHTVLDGDPAPPKGAQHLLFSPHVSCGQTVAHLSY